MLDTLTPQHARRLLEQFGVGLQTATVLLSTAGDNPERLRNAASLTIFCGVNPLPTSSGKTVRHRLNRGGNRAANNALWTIAMIRMRGDPQTRSYVARGSAQGLSSKEFLRCLKRYIAREFFGRFS
ncbi:transposase [Aeromonas veronii]|uniref:transposase n=1 Tax=Aeromonas veronii TaxID=654 RepID=UPI003B52F531